MKLIFSVLCCAVLLLLGPAVEAKWNGPITFFKAQWGAGEGQVRMDNGDGEDPPTIKAVTPDGKVIISDMVSCKEVVIGPDGKVIKEVHWQVTKQEGDRTYYEILEYRFFGKIISYSDDGNIYVKGNNKYYLLSPTGKTLATYDDRPKEIKQSNHKDVVAGLLVTRYNADNQLIDQLRIESDDHRNFHYDYGEPFITPRGDVYVWKKTPSHYVILKWTWTDNLTRQQNQ